MPAHERCGKGAGGQNGSGSCFDIVRRLERWYRVGSTTNKLLPGAGKIIRLFLDDAMDLWLHPDPRYLASFPALDPNLRDSLHELLREARTGIHLLVLPRALSELRTLIML